MQGQSDRCGDGTHQRRQNDYVQESLNGRGLCGKDGNARRPRRPRAEVSRVRGRLGSAVASRWGKSKWNTATYFGGLENLRKRCRALVTNAAPPNHKRSSPRLSRTAYSSATNSNVPFSLLVLRLLVCSRRPRHRRMRIHL